MRKTWSLPDYQAEAIHGLLVRAMDLSGEGSAALVTMDGKPLHVRAIHPADTATLPAAASLCQQYLRLKDGDVAILNDPFTGGTRLSDITLVAGISFESQEPCEVLFALRLSFAPRTTIDGKIDDEGVRLPPMPLASQGQINREILAAVAAAPQAPAGLGESVENALRGIERVRAFLKSCGRDPSNDLRKANFKKYLDSAHEAGHHWVARLPLGETLVTSNLESGELLKLRLEVVEDRVIFDFTGTEPSTRVQLTDLATFGACFHAIEAAISSTLGQPFFANAGTFQLIEVHAPGRTWVNAKAPAATARGVSDGLAAISALALKAFGKLATLHRMGESATGSSRLRFDFKNGLCLTDATPGGRGARKEVPGLSGRSLSLESETQLTSIEKIERAYPIQVRAVVIRPSSGGRGKWLGGCGLVKTYAVLEPARLSWALEQMRVKPEGAENGKGGMPPELTLRRAGAAEEEKLTASGTVELQPGDLVHLHTAGGGGFGEAEPASPSA